VLLNDGVPSTALFHAGRGIAAILTVLAAVLVTFMVVALELLEAAKIVIVAGPARGTTIYRWVALAAPFVLIQWVKLYPPVLADCARRLEPEPKVNPLTVISAAKFDVDNVLNGASEKL
jgi:hypothetical protein